MEKTRMRKLLSIAAFCTIALAGCHSDEANVTITPVALKGCGPTNVPSTVQVHWKVIDANPKSKVNIWISNEPTSGRIGVFGDTPGTLWVTGGSTGTATTGPWMFPGTSIIVTNAKNNDLLAMVKIPAAPCK
jgi:hypothetical protein